MRVLQILDRVRFLQLFGASRKLLPQSVPKLLELLPQAVPKLLELLLLAVPQPERRKVLL